MRLTLMIYIAALFSGAAALIYETLWTRSFSIILGSTVEASSATFAGFITGLAVGAITYGKYLKRFRNSVRIYILTEIAIAVSACLIGFTLFFLRNDIAALLGDKNQTFFLAKSIPLVFLTVFIPTFFMGGTYPALLKIAADFGNSLSSIGKIYAVNILGASLGTLMCAFLFIPKLGVLNSLFMGVAFNLISGSVFLLDLKLPFRKRLSEKLQKPRMPASDLKHRPAKPVLLITAFISGFAVLSLEIIWIRFAGYFLGNRTFAFSTLLFCVLLLLSGGSWLSNYLLKKFSSNINLLFGSIIVFAAFSVFLSSILVDRFIVWQHILDRFSPGFELLFIFYRIAETLIISAPIFIVLGTLFPMSLTCSVYSMQNSSEKAGEYYLINTMGSLSGALLTGFWGIRYLGAYFLVALLIIGLLCASLIFFIREIRSQRKTTGLLGILTATIIFMLFPIILPPSLGYIKAGEKLIFRKEDQYGVYQVILLKNGLMKVTNNKTELIYLLGSISTSYVQQMQGHLGMFFNPDARKSLVLGSGYGITAGAIASYPGMDEVTAVEIIPAMIEAAHLFEPFNFSYHRNSKIRVINDDARHYLVRSKKKFDIITVNVSDPHLPGGTNLFHTDFYDLAKARLEPKGIIIQHAFGTDIAIVMSTIAHSFKYFYMFPSYRNGFNIVASDEPLVLNAGKVDAFSANPTLAKIYDQIGLIGPLKISSLFSKGYTEKDFPHLFKNKIASDNYPWLEFSMEGSLRLLFFSNE
jgi:spermidine synthase